VAYSFFVLVNGEADVLRRNRRVATLGPPGDCFGELAHPAPAPNRHGDTDGASRLLAISAHNFRPLLMASP
jgi:hypothetical protein